MLCDSRQHARSNFFFVVESPYVIGVSRIALAKLTMRARLGDNVPAYFLQRFQDTTGPGAGPSAHAQTSLMDLGTRLEFSTSSAMDRKARAYALDLASSSVFPYANAPGISGISAIQRPSASRSVSILNRKSWLLKLCGGLRAGIRIVKMRHISARCTLLRYCRSIPLVHRFFYFP